MPGVPSIVHEAAGSPGQPLEPLTRDAMESRFSHDFSHVRVHADGRAARAAFLMDARAFTTGDHVVFGAGEFAPQTDAGRRLLSHELTHVVQQRAGVQRAGEVGEAGDPFERHAEAVAERISRGGAVRSLFPGPGGAGGPRLATPALQRQDGAGAAAKGAKPVVKAAQAGKKPDPPKDPLVAAFETLVHGLERAERFLMGDATQSWGMSFWGEGTSSAGSTAAKPSKDVVYLNSSSFELQDVLDMMDVLILSASSKSEMFATPGDLKEKPLEVLYDWMQKVEAIKKALDEEAKRQSTAKGGTPSRTAPLQQKVKSAREQAMGQAVKVGVDGVGFIPVHNPALNGSAPAVTGAPSGLGTSPGKPGSKAAGTATQPTGTQPKPGKVVVAEWIAHDNAGNSFSRIKYSDGSYRYVLGSIFGIRDIEDPGITEWKKVK
ncbi:MAG TPA: DUF4157 domain-containing protein [Longimicrobium sp.]